MQKALLATWKKNEERDKRETAKVERGEQKEGFRSGVDSYRPLASAYCRDVRKARFARLEQDHVAISLAHGPGWRWCYTNHSARGCAAVRCTHGVAGDGVAMRSSCVVCSETTRRCVGSMHAHSAMKSSRTENGNGAGMHSAWMGGRPWLDFRRGAKTPADRCSRSVPETELALENHKAMRAYTVFSSIKAEETLSWLN